jgi:hypothetical protein
MVTGTCYVVVPLALDIVDYDQALRNERGRQLAKGSALDIPGA